MNKYTIVNKANRPMRIFAETEQRAIDIAMDHRHAYKEENLTITHTMKAPDAYHEGVAYRQVPLSSLNIETLEFEKVGDQSKMGWYGGKEQQPKVNDPDWD